MLTNDPCTLCFHRAVNEGLKARIKELEAVVKLCADSGCKGEDIDGCAGGGNCKGCDTGEAQCAAQKLA